MSRGKNIMLNDGVRAEQCVSKSGRTSEYVVDPVTVFMQEAIAHELLTPEEEIELGRQIQAGVRIDESLKLPANFKGGVRKREQAEETLSVARGAVDTMVLSNLRLVAKVATRYGWSTLGYDELIHEGTIGLMTAAKKFDPDKGFKFSTYSVWWIRQAIGHCIGKTARMVRLPAVQEQHLSKLREAMDKEPGRPVADLCTELGFNADIMRDALDASRGVVSLDMPLDKNDDQSDPREGRLIDRMAEKTEETDGFDYDHINIERNLRQLLLPKFPRRGHRMMHIITRELLEAAEPEAVAEELNLTTKQVSELRGAAYAYLRSLGRGIVASLTEPAEHRYKATVASPSSHEYQMYQTDFAEAG